MIGDRVAKAIRGAVAGAIATGTMTLAMGCAKSIGLVGEMPPKTLTRRVLGRLGFRVRGPSLEVAATLAHLGFGMVAGALYAQVGPTKRPIAYGTAFGLAIWAGSYAGWIPRAGLMLAPRFDRPGRPTSMFVAHAIYGATLGSLLRRLQARSERLP